MSAIHDRYNHSPKGRERARRYLRTQKALEVKRKYQTSPKGRETHRSYHAVKTDKD